jgi:hypothetical protein
MFIFLEVLFSVGEVFRIWQNLGGVNFVQNLIGIDLLV